MIPCVFSGALAPTLHIFTSGTSATETIPAGASQVIIELWGPGGGGGGTTGSGCAITAGGGAGSGAYSRTVLSVIGQSGNTFTYTIGAVGTGGAANANGTDGGTSTVVAGTVTGYATQTSHGGNHGVAGGGPGTGGTATGGTAANTTGNTGSGTTGGIGVTGTVSGDGGPYGQGGIGHGNSIVGAGGNGLAGAVVFFYT